MIKFLFGCLIFTSLIGCTSSKDQYKIGDCYAIAPLHSVGILVQINDSSLVFRVQSGGYIVFDKQTVAKAPITWCGGIK